MEFIEPLIYKLMKTKLNRLNSNLSYTGLYFMIHTISKLKTADVKKKIVQMSKFELHAIT